MEAIGPDGGTVNSRYLRTMYRNSYRWSPGMAALLSDSRSVADVCVRVGTPISGACLYWGDIYSQMIMNNLVHTSTVLSRRERQQRVRGRQRGAQGVRRRPRVHLHTCREGIVSFADVTFIRCQVGRSDQLTQPVYAIHMARVFLGIIQPALIADSSRIRLPARMLDAVQAFEHDWVDLLEPFKPGQQRAGAPVSASQPSVQELAAEDLYCLCAIHAAALDGAPGEAAAATREEDDTRGRRPRSSGGDKSVKRRDAPAIS